MTRAQIASYFLLRHSGPRTVYPARNHFVHRTASPNQQRQKHSVGIGSDDHCDDTRHGCESDCEGSTNGDYVWDCAKNDAVGIEISRAGSDSQNQDRTTFERGDA